MKSPSAITLGIGIAALAAFGAASAADGALTSTAKFGELDRNQDSRVSMVEAQVQPSLRSSFATLDRNADGYLTQAEFSGWQQDRPATPATTPGGADKHHPTPVE